MHLINKGITVRPIIENQPNGSLETIIEWGLAGPSDIDHSEVTFICTLDDFPPSECEYLRSWGEEHFS